jgi:hypothetical protein
MIGAFVRVAYCVLLKTGAAEGADSSGVDS